MSTTLVHQPLGRHLLADLHGIAPALLTQTGQLEAILRQAALRAGARILHSHFHSFGAAMGVTGVVLLAESHISIHTWPEAGFAAADIFMCGDARPELALAWIREALDASHCEIRTLIRGRAQDECGQAGRP